MSISSTFYELLFHKKVLFAAYLCLEFDFVFFRRKTIGEKVKGKQEKIKNDDIVLSIAKKGLK